MKLIDRYILKKFFSTFFFAILLMIVVIALIDITEKAGYYSRHQLSFQQIAGYYVAFIPYMISLIMPITVFITTVLMTAKLAQRTEIIAILSSRVSFLRLALPYFIGAMCITLVNFAMTGWFLAKANKKRVDFEKQYIDPCNLDKQKKNCHIQISPTQYLYIERYWNYHTTGSDVTLETIHGNQVVERLFAKRMRWLADTAQWQFKSWMIRKIEGLDESITQGDTLEMTLDLYPEDMIIDPKLRETLTISELNRYIRRLKSRGDENFYSFLAEKYTRYMSPFALLILTCMGLLVASHKSRRGIGVPITLGFILALTYMCFFIFTKTLAEANGTHLLLKIWLPNSIFSIFCCIGYWFVPK